MSMKEWLRDEKTFPIPKKGSDQFIVSYTRRTSQEGNSDDFEEKFADETSVRKFAKFIEKQDVVDLKLYGLITGTI